MKTEPMKTAAAGPDAPRPLQHGPREGAAGPEDVVVTGDRPTGALHLGHYAGSLQNRVALQEVCRQYVLIADLQAFTDNAGGGGKISRNIVEVALDQLAAGIDPEKTTLFLQSAVPELAELSTHYLALVTLARLERNPTIRDEMRLRSFRRDVPAGFVCYPASQAADITAFKATLVPAGADQGPMIELANEVAASVNRLAGRALLPQTRLMAGSAARLPGIDGKAKASKSLGNAIALGAEADEIRAKVRAMYTDEGHLRIEDPGRVEGNVVFAYLDAFDPEPAEVAALKERYRAGGLGDAVLKRRLVDVLEALIGPIRERRRRIDRSDALRILLKGSEMARATAAGTLREVRDALGVADLRRALAKAEAQDAGSFGL